MEDEVDDGETVQLTDWKVTTMSQPVEATKRKTQTSIQDWTGKRVRLETAETVPDVKKPVKTIPKKRQTGKLTKKEQRNMKKTHKKYWSSACPSKTSPGKGSRDNGRSG